MNCFSLLVAKNMHAAERITQFTTSPNYPPSIVISRRFQSCTCMQLLAGSFQWSYTGRLDQANWFWQTPCIQRVRNIRDIVSRTRLNESCADEHHTHGVDVTASCAPASRCQYVLTAALHHIQRVSKHNDSFFSRPCINLFQCRFESAKCNMASNSTFLTSAGLPCKQTHI